MIILMVIIMGMMMMLVQHPSRIQCILLSWAADRGSREDPGIQARLQYRARLIHSVLYNNN